MARDGGGKSGGYRTLIFFRKGTRAVCVFGFAKSDRANINAEETIVYKKAAKLVLSFSEEQMDIEVDAGRLVEVQSNDENL